MVWGLRRLVRQWRPELVHAHGWIAYSCAAALLGTAIPLEVVSVRDYGYTCALRTLLHDGKCLRRAGASQMPELRGEIVWAAQKRAAVAGVFAGRALLTHKIAATHSVSTFVQQTVRRDLLRNGLGAAKLDRESIPDIVVPSFLVESGDTALDQAYTDRLPDRPYILFVGALQPHKGLGRCWRPTSSWKTRRRWC